MIVNEQQQATPFCIHLWMAANSPDLAPDSSPQALPTPCRAPVSLLPPVLCTQTLPCLDSFSTLLAWLPSLSASWLQPHLHWEAPPFQAEYSPFEAVLSLVPLFGILLTEGISLRWYYLSDPSDTQKVLD